MRFPIIVDNNSINISKLNSTVPPVVPDTDDAGGMLKSHWYVAIVNHNSEKISAGKLIKKGIDCYVATQKQMRVHRNGKRVIIDHVVIGSTIFIRCTEKQRRVIIKEPFIFRFLTNRAGALNEYGRPVAIVPDEQIHRLRFMLGNSDTPVTIVDRVYGKGDRVKVVRGSLKGLEGEVINAGVKSELLVRIDILGCAKCVIDPVDVQPIDY